MAFTGSSGHGVVKREGGGGEVSAASMRAKHQQAPAHTKTKEATKEEEEAGNKQTGGTTNKYAGVKQDGSGCRWNCLYIVRHEQRGS